MPHPYFEVTVYPLHRPEAEALFNELANAYKNANAIDLLYKKCGDNLPDLFLQQVHTLIWKEVLENLTSRGFLRKLLDLVQPLFLNSATMQKAIRDVINAESGEDINIISPDVLVLDRGTLRDKLKEVAADTNPLKVLIVRGLSKSGKSHGRYIFEQFARDKGSEPVYIYPEMAPTVGDLINNLFSALGAMDQIPPAFTTSEAWYRTACTKLLDVCTKQNKRLWIAVDGLGTDAKGNKLVSTEVKEFCDIFALNMLNPPFRKNFRLMLIHYPEGTTPANWHREFWIEERTNEADVKQEHVAELLKKWAISKDKTIVEDQLKQLAAEVIANAEAPLPPNETPKPRLQRIHDELKKKIEELGSNSQ